MWGKSKNDSWNKRSTNKRSWRLFWSTFQLESCLQRTFCVEHSYSVILNGNNFGSFQLYRTTLASGKPISESEPTYPNILVNFSSTSNGRKLSYLWNDILKKYTVSIWNIIFMQELLIILKSLDGTCPHNYEGGHLVMINREHY